MTITATKSQDLSAIQALSLDGLTISLLAKAHQFERLAVSESYTATLLRRASDTLKRLERERTSLAADMDAVCLARDAAGILGSPADAIAILDEENRRLKAELDTLRQNMPALGIHAASH
ncbi:hypothetical protein DFR49_0752 [Hephaestia caeni]|uniref:Uncharacterized protein n=1 Tax=Hephaestia caeni TaxID=645617 RepID=A0A397PE66_9SPHN|nr:hypothetical protein [Hephaestia caeni]RIA46219.1 hypothetical protein DFR49_0752 [Hephaestia caeni]